MKRILIFTPSFSIGGTNSSLQAFLSYVDPSVLRVDIVSQLYQGPYRNNLPNCTVLKENIWICKSIVEGNAFKKFFNILLRIIKRLFSYVGCDLTPLFVIIAGSIYKTRNYDAVISYQEDLSELISYLPAKKRIGWIRCEYDRYYEIHNYKDESVIFSRIDYIVCVSNFARNSVLKYYPNLDKKIVVINNFMNVEEIKIKAKEDKELHPSFNYNQFTIVSIGRIDRVKQFEQIPLIAKEIKEQTDIPFRWYIIGGSRGDNELDKLIQQRITDCGLKNEVLLLGEISNVYPYIVKSNIFVHTSKSETFSRVVNEAKALSVPPVINNYACAPEFVKNGVEGFIVENSKMSSLIVDLMEHPRIVNSIKLTLDKNTYNNGLIYSQINDLLDRSF